MGRQRYGNFPDELFSADFYPKTGKKSLVDTGIKATAFYGKLYNKPLA